MSEKMRWVCEGYRGMYVHAIAFEIVQIGRAIPPPGQKWGYLVAVRTTADFDEEMIYGPASDHSDYFTRVAAEQAAIHYGRQLIDIISDLS